MSIDFLLQQAASGASPVDTGDDDFANVILLLDGDGSSDDSNNTFTDSSTNSHTVTESGSVVQGSFSPYGDNWSNYFDSGENVLKVTDSTDFDLGTTWTVEAWIYPNAANSSKIFGTRNGSGDMWELLIYASDKKFAFEGYGANSTSGPQKSSSTFEPNQWYHVAVVTSSGATKLYVDGVLEVNYSNSLTWSTAYGPWIGGTSAFSEYNFDGYVSNLRVVKGTAVYTGAFTPPTEPLTAITNTVLLTCQSNRFVDNSTSSHTITITGTPKVAPFSPFKDDDARDITTDGGSGYWHRDDLSYLTFSGGPSTVSDITISFWIYGENLSQISGSYYPRIFASGTYNASPPGFLVYVRDDDIRIYFGGEVLQTPLNKFEWNYIVAQRSSGTWTLYKNGTSTGTSTTSGSTNIDLSTTNYIGSEAANGYHTGYLADFRITTSGSTSVAVPTSPVSAVTNTELLLNFQDAGIYDRSGINNLNTAGNARLGFAPIYGTGSLEFDGSGDYLELRDNQEVFDLGTGDFTVECWFYANSLSASTYSTLFACHNGGTSEWGAYVRSNGVFVFGSANTLTGAGTVSTSTWHHYAATRSGSTVRVFLDGTQVDTDTVSGSYTTSAIPFRVGIDSGVNSYFDGFIDDLRITRGVARYTSAFTPPDEIDLSTDTYAEYVTLFLDGDGTVNGQNNTFTDSSTNGFTVTESGSVAQGVFSPYGDNWSVYFDGTDDLLKATDPSTLYQLTGDFTVEFWFMRLGGSSTYTPIFGIQPSSGQAGLRIAYQTPGTTFRLISGSGTYYVDIGSSTAPPYGEWAHFAFTRSGSSVKAFIDGTEVGSATSSSWLGTSLDLFIGGGRNAASGVIDEIPGYYSNVRVVKGTAVYTSAFTPPTAPLSDITNTSFLGCTSNRFEDTSSNNTAVTIHDGTPKVSRFSPFESNKPYDITTDGGSGNFSSSALTLADSTSFDFGTGDFTLEAWIYPRTLNDTYDYNSIMSAHDPTAGSPAAQNSWIFTVLNNKKLTIYGGGATTSSSNATVRLNEWSHVMITRSSGTIRFFINGTLDTNTPTVTGNFNCESSGLAIGRQANINVSYARYWDGYISDARIVKGTALQTSSFTPPTAPLTAVTNTELLLNFQDSTIPDLSGLNNIDTLGNAKVGGTDPTKYGSNAMQFDGSSACIASTKSAEIGTADFTLEAWIYPTALNANDAIIAEHWSGTTAGFIFRIFTSNYLSLFDGSTNRTSSTAIVTNQWQHVAASRENGTLKLFIDGTQVLSVATSSSLTGPGSGESLTVGGLNTSSGFANYFTGYIDDVEVTKGVARYTANFTPPTEALSKF